MHNVRYWGCATIGGVWDWILHPLTHLGITHSKSSPCAARYGSHNSVYSSQLSTAYNIQARTAQKTPFPLL
jgi:hypothetical protein